MSGWLTSVRRDIVGGRRESVVGSRGKCGVRNLECGVTPSIPHSELRMPHLEVLFTPGVNQWFARFLCDLFLSIPIPPGFLIETKIHAGQFGEGVDNGLILNVKDLQL